MIEWRDYQLECIEVIKKHFKTKNKQFIQLPTGSGKTFIFLKYLKENSRKSVIIVPSVELKEQIIWNGKNKFGLRITENTEKSANIYVFTAASLNFHVKSKFIQSFEPDHIIIDEAHHAQANTYKKFLKSLVFKYKLIGFTATPERLDGKSLNEIFETLTYDKNILDLIKADHLCDIEAYQYKTNIKIVSTVGGDFSPIELSRLDESKRNDVIVKVFNENCIDKKTIIFCLNIDHSEKISNILKKQGHKSAFIHGKLSYSERKRILQDFKSGKIKVLTNCQILTEGFDEPSIEALIIARPTKSKSLYCQMVGRGIRKFPGKELCYLYEVADNYHKICTFNVLANKDVEFNFDYPQGERLTNLFEKVKDLDFKDILINKEKMNLFEDSAEYSDLEPTSHQMERLKQFGISFMKPLSFLEAAFLIWKFLKMREYGKN